MSSSDELEFSINAIRIYAHAALAGGGPLRQTSSEFATAGKYFRGDAGEIAVARY
jgi:hypothetical protein